VTTGSDLISSEPFLREGFLLGDLPLLLAADGVLCGALEGLLPPGCEVSPAVERRCLPEAPVGLLGGLGSAATRWSNRGNGGPGALTKVIAMLSTTGGEPPLRTRERAGPDQPRTTA